MLEIRKIYLIKHCKSDKRIHILKTKTTSGESVIDVIISGHINTMIDKNGKAINKRITNKI